MCYKRREELTATDAAAHACSTTTTLSPPHHQLIGAPDQQSLAPDVSNLSVINVAKYGINT